MKALFPIFVAGGVIIVGVVAFLFIQPQSVERMIEEGTVQMNAAPSKMSGPSETMPPVENDAMVNTPSNTERSRYVEYSPTVLAESAATRRVLFFYANWCPTCRPADANFQAEVNQIPSDVTVIRVNYDDNETDAEEEALAKQYGVTYQHTFVQIDAQGKAITRWNGGQVTELLKNVKAQ